MSYPDSLCWAVESYRTFLLAYHCSCSISPSAVRNLGIYMSFPVHSQGENEMCYYDNYIYSCRDWKWGNFQQHCNREYRTGETCGMKMIFQQLQLPDRCPFCERIEKKTHRRDKAIKDYKRWASEPQKYQASMERARNEVRSLEYDI